MSRAIAIADRAAPLALKCVAAVNVLFFLAFLGTLLIAASQAQGEMPKRADGGTITKLAAGGPSRLYGFAAFHP